MISLIEYKWIAALSIFMASALLPAILIKKRQIFAHGESMALWEALAAGIFLGAAFFHLLPDAYHLFKEYDPTNKIPVVQIICIGSILLFYLIERFLLLYQTESLARLLPVIVLIILVIHALTEGAAIGIGNTISEVLMLSLAIIAHKGSEGFALAIVLLRHEWELKQVLRLSFFFATMTPLGILIGVNLSIFNFISTELLESTFSSFAAGTFIYIATLHTLHGHSHGNVENIKRILYFIFGIGIMGLLAIWT